MLLYRVVERFGSDVKTQSLKGVVVDDDDYKTIFWAMKRASERSGHDMAAAKNAPLPNIEEIKEEVSALDSYCDREYPKLCVSGLAHSGFRYGHVLKRSAYIIAN